MENDEMLFSSFTLTTLVNKLRISIREDVAELLGTKVPTAVVSGQENLLTRQQLAEKLNVSPNTVQIWDRRGKIPAVRIGTSVRYDYQQVLAALTPKKKTR